MLRPPLKLTRETKAGFKLLAHSEGSVQEIFLVVDKERREKVMDSLKLVYFSSKFSLVRSMDNVKK